MKTAVIDIGSNSVRLMLWADGKTLYKRLISTRLGEGIAFSARLNAEAIERTARAVALFFDEGKKEGANVFAFATASVRSAQNGGEFCARVKELCGLEVDVVSGEEEAKLGLCGVLNDMDGAILDVGGASTELCVKQGKEVFAQSLNIGAVRLYDLCGDDKAKLAPVIEREIKPFSHLFQGKLYAIGGTATTLAALKLRLKEYDVNKVQDCVLSRMEVSDLCDKLFSLSAEVRKGLAGMDARRADIIAGGALLILKVMEILSVEELVVSDRDNLEGYLILRGLK